MIIFASDIEHLMDLCLAAIKVGRGGSGYPIGQLQQQPISERPISEASTKDNPRGGRGKWTGLLDIEEHWIFSDLFVEETQH